MSFTAREIRRGMDVFSSDGVLLGSVVHVRSRPVSAAAAGQTTAAGNSESFSGESLGPAPTAGIGNSGPANQNPSNGYAASIGANVRPPADEPADLLVFRTLVHLDWRTLRPRLRRYPVTLILSVSHERIVLAAPAADLP